MKKLASTLPNMILSLGVVTVVAGAILGGVYTVTKEPIARQAAEAQIQAIREVAPEFDNNPEADKWETTVDGRQVTLYPAKKGGELVGAAVKASSMNGFNGEVSVMAGFTADGTVKDYRVLQQAETPGLGSRMEAWFRDPQAARSVIGKNPQTAPFYVVKDADKHGTVDGITAATISSRAFLECLRDAFEAYKAYQSAGATAEHDAASGASSHCKTSKNDSHGEK